MHVAGRPVANRCYADFRWIMIFFYLKMIKFIRLEYRLTA